MIYIPHRRKAFRHVPIADIIDVTMQYYLNDYGWNPTGILRARVNRRTNEIISILENTVANGAYPWTNVQIKSSSSRANALAYYCSGWAYYHDAWGVAWYANGDFYEDIVEDTWYRSAEYPNSTWGLASIERMGCKIVSFRG